MIYFLSDAHLGSKALPDGEAHQQRVVSLLNQMSKDASAIYMLGDMFDFWCEYLWDKGTRNKEQGQRNKEQGQRTIPKSKQQFAPFLQCLKQLTSQGIEVHFFTGNHDMWTFGWLERATGVIVHRGVFVTELYGKKVLMAHGDGLVPRQCTMHDARCTMSREQQKKIKAFIRLQKLFHNPVAQTIFRCLPPCVGDAVGYAWAKKSRLKDLEHPCGYKGENQEELILWSKEQGQRNKEQGQRSKDYYIFGHRHIELDLMISHNTRVMILGDMFRAFTYAQMDEKGDIQLCIQETNN